MKEVIVVALFALTGATAPAAAGSPVAIVEEVHGKVTGAEPMDYVAPRTVIKLGQNGSIVLSYMNSCRREEITGIGGMRRGPLARYRSRDQRGRRDRRAEHRKQRFLEPCFAEPSSHALRRFPPGRSKRSRHADHGASRHKGRTSAD